MKLLDWILLLIIAAAVVAAIIVWRKQGSCSCSSGGCCGDCSNCGSPDKCTKTDSEPQKTIPSDTEEPVLETLELIGDEQIIDPSQSRTTEEYLQFQQQLSEENKDK